MKHGSVQAESVLLPRSGSQGAKKASPGGWSGLGWLWSAASAPLFAVALSFGVVNAVYWSFAVDLVSGADSSPTTGPVFYAVLGVAGFVGLFTGDLSARFGLRRVLRATLASLGVAAGLLGLAAGWLPAVGVSAVLFGAGTMVMSALLSVWSSAVFRERPSTGFSAVLLLFGAGSALGPGAAGIFAAGFGLDTAFLLTAALASATAFMILPDASKGSL